MKSIKMKFTVILVLLLLLVSTGLGTSAYFISNQTLTNNTNIQLQTLARLGASHVEEVLNREFSVLDALAHDETICDPSVSIAEKVRLLQAQAKEVGAINITISDLEGNAIAPDGTASIDIKDREYFKQAIAGNRFVSDPIENKANPGTLMIAFAIPLKWNDQIVGIIFKAADGNCLSDITDSIAFGETGKAFMINAEGTTIANYTRELVLAKDNVINNAAKDSTLAKMAEVQKEMIKGTNGYGHYEYKGVEKYVGYSPVKGTPWFLAVTAAKSEVLSGMHSLTASLLMIGAIFFIVSIAIGYVFSSIIAKPIKMITKKLAGFAEGDFTTEVSYKLLRLKDETGQLAGSLTDMQSSIRKVIQVVQSEAKEVSNSANTQEQNVTNLLREIEEVSATTEELSAGSQETAASTQEMQASSTLIESALLSISDRTQDGSHTAVEINKRAANLKSVALESKNNAISIYKDSETTLKEAIERSKEVNQINSLSETILEISSQTNLLALNASIEAARAGEAGKGFAVVASEIGKLAIDSERSVNEIQKVTNNVVVSVENLADCSRKLLEFVDKHVLRDYDMLVTTSEQYSKDAALVDNIVSDLSLTTEQLYSTIHNMMKAINEVTSATNESAEGTNHIAERTSTIVNESNIVLELSQNTKESSEKLVEAVSIFKI